MRNSFAFLWSALAAVVAVTLFAGCQSRAERIHELAVKHFAQLDTDGDGQWSRAEFSASHIAQHAADPDAAFKKIDANHNGFISPDEIRDALDPNVP